jgi:hypothetical protein
MVEELGFHRGTQPLLPVAPVSTACDGQPLVQRLAWVQMADPTAQLTHVHPAEPVAEHLDGAPGRVGHRAAQA